jgi:hypothetical protein
MAGAHHIDIATKHGLVPSRGTRVFEGVRADVEAAAKAYRAAGYFVTENPLAGGRVMVDVRSTDGDFATALSSWAGDGPSYHPAVDRGVLDVPMTNNAVRGWYKDQIKRIAALNDTWIHEMIPLEERARRAYEIRKQARLAAREQMASSGDVAALNVRDIEVYGDSDGPSFEAMVAEKMAKGLTREAALESIIDSSRRSNQAYDRKHGAEEKPQ